ncbi:hypothetical protein ABZ897_17315 [Nonomuraea sp. NPDC046802]|uniref:hypothetical protein n=1 Tax=Nonomuraea sp. NPDC046802 TaxID=3154919 RepID=UPI0033EDEAB8
MSELPVETGDERVDAIVADLGRLGELPVSAHVAVFDEAFAGLESTLSHAVDDQSAAQGDRGAMEHGQSAVELAQKSAQEHAAQAMGRP